MASIHLETAIPGPGIVATHDSMVQLAEVLNEAAPGDFAEQTLLMNSGAEAVESAVKIARVATGRAGVLVFEGGYRQPAHNEYQKIEWA